MDWLESTLRDQPRKVHELRTEAETKGWAAKVLYAAKTKLGLIQTETQNVKWWGLKL